MLPVPMIAMFTAVPVVSARDRDSTSQTSEGAQRDHNHFVAAE
jgi:hypothetical protein